MIEARGITKRFGAFTAVDDVSLAVRPGEFLTLLGPSGCGKTTLLRVLAGFEAPDEGAVLLEGKEITALPPYRRNVNQVFQSYALFPHLTVQENVAFGLRMRRVPAAERNRRIRAALEGVALAGFEGRKPDQLSGGQRQRVALARALVCEPKVLLLDEPLSALDAKLRRAMQLELKHLQRRSGLSFIFVTHDQQEALTLSDRIAIMNAGRIEQVGGPEEIYRRPRTAFAADFIGQANLFPVEILERGAPGARVRSGEGWELLTGTAEGLPTATAALVSIRPEKIRLGRAPLPGPNAFACRIEERLFQGPADRVVVLTSAGVRLQVLIGAGEGEPWREGESAFGAIDSGDVVTVQGYPGHGV